MIEDRPTASEEFDLLRNVTGELRTACKKIFCTGNVNFYESVKEVLWIMADQSLTNKSMEEEIIFLSTELPEVAPYPFDLTKWINDISSSESYREYGNYRVILKKDSTHFEALVYYGHSPFPVEEYYMRTSFRSTHRAKIIATKFLKYVAERQWNNRINNLFEKW